MHVHVVVANVRLNHRRSKLRQTPIASGEQANDKPKASGVGAVLFTYVSAYLCDGV